MRKVISSEYFILLVTLSVMILIVYYPYISLREVFVYTDIAGDTYLTFVPYYIAVANALRTRTIGWSFNAGLGMNLYTASYAGNIWNILDWPLFILGERYLVYGFIYVQCFRVLLAGIFFYLFLKKLKRNQYTSLIISIMYAFSSHIILRGSWYHHANDGLLFAFMLYAFELYYQDSNIKLLSVSSLLVVLIRPHFYPFHYLLIITGYALFRIIYNNHFSLKESFRIILKLWFLYALGLLMGSIIFLPMMNTIVHSPRSLESSNSIIKMIFSITSLNELKTAFLTLLSPLIMGGGYSFIGFLNYLEAPQLYCGLASIIFTPLAVKSERGMKRAALLMLIGCCFAYLLFPIIRMFFTGFINSNSYKYSSFWVTISILYISAIGLDYLFDQKNDSCNKRITPIILIIIICCIVFFGFSNVLDNYYATVTILFLIAYLCVFVLCDNRGILKKLLTFLIISEMTFMSYYVVNDRKIIDKETLWDHSNEVIEYLNSTDQDFFRMEKSYTTVSKFNDALLQGYNGTAAYHSFINKTLHNFYGIVAPETVINVNQLSNLREYYKLGTLLSVKYILAHNNDSVYPYYELKQEIHDINVYENELFMPLGYTYDRYIKYNDFVNLEPEEMHNVLAKAFVLGENAAEDFTRIEALSLKCEKYEPQLFPIDSIFKDYGQLEILVNQYPESLGYKTLFTDPKFTIAVDKPQEFYEKMVISFNLSSEEDCMGQVFWKTSDMDYSEGQSKWFGIDQGEKSYNIEIRVPANVTELRIDTGDAENVCFTITDFKIRGYTVEYADFIHDISHRRENSLNITEHSNNYISGHIEVEGEKMLFLSIPYDKGWKAFVNGEKAELLNINIAFMGIILDEGAYNVVLRYTPPYLYWGALLSLIGVVLYILLIWFGHVRKRR